MSLKKAREKVAALEAQIESLEEELANAEKRLLKAESKQKFKCSKCKESNQLKDMTLYGTTYHVNEVYNTFDEFVEYHIVCPCGHHHRTLSKESREKWGIPQNYKGVRCRSSDFESKFKSTTIKDIEVRGYSFTNI